LRDRGVDAYWNDKYSKNLLAMGFDFKHDFKPDAVVAFEVMEHLVDPLETVSEIMNMTDCFIFSTLTVPHVNFTNNKDWWYFVPESGQHVFLSSEKALRTLAETLGCRYKRIHKMHVIYRGNTFNFPNPLLLVRSLGTMVLDRMSVAMSQGFGYASKVWSDNAMLKERLKK
jgi:hypothetical protein